MLGVTGILEFLGLFWQAGFSSAETEWWRSVIRGHSRTSLRLWDKQMAFIQQMFMAQPVCARSHGKHWGHNDEHERGTTCPQGARSPEQTFGELGSDF